MISLHKPTKTRQFFVNINCNVTKNKKVSKMRTKTKRYACFPYQTDSDLRGYIRQRIPNAYGRDTRFYGDKKV